MTDDPAASFTRARAAAGVLFFDERGRLMLVDPSYKDYREVPGDAIRLDGTTRYLENGERT